VSLIGHDGKTIWLYNNGMGINDAAGGNLYGDEQEEFVVGYGGDGGVVLLDGNGSEIWRQPEGNVWHVELADTDGTGKLKIVHSNVGGGIVVRDAKGHILSQKELPLYLGDFSLCNWPGHGSRQYGLAAGNYLRDESGERSFQGEKGRIWVFDFAGNIVADFKAPFSNDAYDVRGALVKGATGRPEYLAAVTTFSEWPRSVFYLFKLTGEVVYQEVLGEKCRAIAAIPINESAADSILIGGENKIWRYDLQTPSLNLQKATGSDAKQ